MEGVGYYFGGRGLASEGVGVGKGIEIVLGRRGWEGFVLTFVVGGEGIYDGLSDWWVAAADYDGNGFGHFW